jgi:hypothetical protein
MTVFFGHEVLLVNLVPRPSLLRTASNLPVVKGLPVPVVKDWQTPSCLQGLESRPCKQVETLDVKGSRLPATAGEQSIHMGCYVTYGHLAMHTKLRITDSISPHMNTGSFLLHTG